MPGIRIRPAGPEDVEGLAWLCAEHAAFEGSATRIDALWPQRLAQALARRHFWVWLAETQNDGELIGYASATQDYATLSAASFLHMDCLYLRAQARGFGLGQQLMAAVQACARAQGCQQLQWQTPIWNEAAACFYRRQGAHMLPKQRFTLQIHPQRPEESPR